MVEIVLSSDVDTVKGPSNTVSWSLSLCFEVWPSNFFFFPALIKGSSTICVEVP